MSMLSGPSRPNGNGPSVNFSIHVDAVGSRPAQPLQQHHQPHHGHSQSHGQMQAHAQGQQPTMVTALDQNGCPIGQIWMQLPPASSFDPSSPVTLAIPQSALPAGTAYAQIPSGHPSNPPQIVSVVPETRTRLTRDQHHELESHFQSEPKPSTTDKKVISARFGVSLDKINNWFQNRRAKVRQDMRKQMMVNALTKAGLDAETVQNVKGKISFSNWRRKSSVSGQNSPVKTSRAGSVAPDRAAGPTLSSSPPPKVPSLGRRLHPSASTPNLHMPYSHDVVPPLPTAPILPAGIDPRLLTVSGPEEPGMMPASSSDGLPLYSFPAAHHTQTHGHHHFPSTSTACIGSSSPVAPERPIYRHTTPDRAEELRMSQSTANLTATLSQTTLQSSVKHEDSQMRPRDSVSPSPLSGQNAVGGARRKQRSGTARPLRAVASMGVLPTVRTDDYLNEPIPVCVVPSKKPERTIRKIRSGVSKQGSTVGLSSLAKMQSGGTHSRSVSSTSVGASISPNKRDRRPIPPVPSLANLKLAGGDECATVMPSQLVGHIGIPSPPVADTDRKSGSIPSAPGLNAMLSSNQMSQMNSSLCGLTTLGQTASPPTTPLHLSTLQQLSRTQPTAGFDMGMYATMPLFDQSVGTATLADLATFDSLAGFAGLEGYGGFGQDDGLAGLSQMYNPVGQVGIASSNVPANGCAGPAMVSMASLNGVPDYPLASFDSTPTFRPDDPFVTPDFYRDTSF